MKIHYKNPIDRYGKKLASFAEFFRKQALAIDKNPTEILKHVDHPAIQFLLTDRHSTTYERTCYLEALGYGDPSVLLACPGPSLSGLIIRELGTEDQINFFFNFLRKHQAQTFFALTEPFKGSDANQLECELIADEYQKRNYYLNGEKCLFGNGAVGKIGVVIARTHPHSLGIRAVLITPDKLEQKNNWIIRKKLPMTGLRGAQLAYMQFNHCPITSENLLGEHLKPTQHGMMAVIKTFNRLRTGVGALAIGQSQALLDYVYYNKFNWGLTDKKIYCNLYHKIESARHLLKQSARKIDDYPLDGQSASIAKFQAISISKYVITTIFSLLDTDIFLENPWIAKCYRDCFAWEYMEGTSTMQLKNVLTLPLPRRTL